LLYAAIREARRIASEWDTRPATHVLIGLLLFALLCLRTTYLVPAFAVAAALYLAMLWKQPRLTVVTAALVALGVVAACAVPWMIVTQRIAGTPFYPLLGFGTMTHEEVAAYTAIPTLLKTGIRILGCYALAGVGVWRIATRHGDARQETFLLLLTPLLLFLILMSETKYTVFGFRYAYVGTITLPLFWFVELLKRPPVPHRPGTGIAVSLALMLLMLVRHESWHPDTVASGQLYVWAVGRPYSIFRPIQDVTAERQNFRAAMRTMQDATPPGQLILARLDAPFLMDFRRNPIWVMDHPGLMGPQPGVPLSNKVAPWTRYLHASGVEYVAYSYANQAGESAESNAQFLHVNGPSHWQTHIANQTAAVQAMLLKLRATQPLIYDDGTRYVAALTAMPMAESEPSP